MMERGIYLPPPLHPELVDETVSYLRRFPMYASHVELDEEADQFLYWTALRQLRAFTPGERRVVRAPHWFEHALTFYEQARDYLGEAWLYSINAFWTTGWYGETQGWHRDLDADKQFAVFMFGTDVPGEAGSHLYQRGSHNPIRSTAPEILGYDMHSPPPDIVETVTGPRGTIFAVDPAGLHRGVPPKGPRLLFWARWSNMKLPTIFGDRPPRTTPKELLGSRYPTNPELQEAISLVVS